jgi:hypothetical protein
MKQIPSSASPAHANRQVSEDGQVLVLDVAGGAFVPAGGAPPGAEQPLDTLQ